MEDLPTETAISLVDRLREAGETVAVAESFTGGRVANSLVAVPGASDVFREAIVAYVYGTKMAALGVSREILDEHGAVSAPTAKAMARGIRDIVDTTWGVATTGVAGPTGGSEDTPVGTTYIGVAYAAPWGTTDSYARAEHHVLDGDRVTVIDTAAAKAVAALAEDVSTSDGNPPTDS
ncbi:MAG: CinA family protein [Halobacteriaceae archaeon]